MRHYIVLILLVWLSNIAIAQSDSIQPVVEKSPYKSGEYLKYRIHFGFINAGYATLNLENTTKNGFDVLYAKGKGWTTGAAKMFYVVHDVYESHFTAGKDVKPIFFRRRVDEDGYLIQRDLTFDHQKHEVEIFDLKENKTDYMTIGDVQDMVSSFYYLRNVDIDQIKEGDEVMVNLFFDSRTFPFKLQFEKREIIRTKFGKIRTWRIRPMVQEGRVFKSKESLTIWVTDDANKIPIRIKASLVVGSLKADLDAFKGLSNGFPVIND